MTVEIIDDKELWDTFIDKSTYGTLYHKWNFLKIVQKYTGCKCLPYGIYKGETLISLFPLFYKKINGLKSISSPPMGSGIPYLGVVMNSKYDDLKQNKKENFLNIVSDEINNEINKFSPNYVGIQTVPSFLDVRPFSWNNYNVNPFYTYTIDLNKTLDEINGNFHKKLRNKIASVESLNSNLNLVKSSDVSILYNLLDERYTAQGLNLTINDSNYLKDILKEYPKNVGLYYLYDDNRELIGAQLTQEYNRRFSLWMGSPKIKNNNNGNEYMTWKLIQKAKLEGYKKFEIIGANTRKLCEFKTKFNPSLENYYHITKSDYVGKIAGWTYLNFYKKRRILKR